MRLETKIRRSETAAAMATAMEVVMVEEEEQRKEEEGKRGETHIAMLLSLQRMAGSMTSGRPL